MLPAAKPPRSRAVPVVDSRPKRIITRSIRHPDYVAPVKTPADLDDPARAPSPTKQKATVAATPKVAKKSKAPPKATKASPVVPIHATTPPPTTVSSPVPTAKKGRGKVSKAPTIISSGDGESAPPTTSAPGPAKKPMRAMFPVPRATPPPAPASPPVPKSVPEIVDSTKTPKPKKAAVKPKPKVVGPTNAQLEAALLESVRLADTAYIEDPCLLRLMETTKALPPNATSNAVEGDPITQFAIPWHLFTEIHEFEVVDYSGDAARLDEFLDPHIGLDVHLKEVMSDFVRTGPRGVIALCLFLQGFVNSRALDISHFTARLERLGAAMAMLAILYKGEATGINAYIGDDPMYEDESEDPLNNEMPGLESVPAHSARSSPSPALPHLSLSPQPAPKGKTKPPPKPATVKSTIPTTAASEKPKFSEKPFSAAGRAEEIRLWGVYAASTQALATSENIPVDTVRAPHAPFLLSMKAAVVNAWNGFVHEFCEKKENIKPAGSELLPCFISCI